MGWMEVLAMLKRIAPLLNRLAPMLEAFLAGRTGGKADATAAMERLSSDLKGQLAESGEVHSGLANALREQAIQMAQLAGDVGSLQVSNQSAHVQLAAIHASLLTLKRLILIVGIGLLLITAATFGLLVILILHSVK